MHLDGEIEILSRAMRNIIMKNEHFKQTDRNAYRLMKVQRKKKEKEKEKEEEKVEEEEGGGANVDVHERVSSGDNGGKKAGCKS